MSTCVFQIGGMEFMKRILLAMLLIPGTSGLASATTTVFIDRSTWQLAVGSYDSWTEYGDALFFWLPSYFAHFSTVVIYLPVSVFIRSQSAPQEFA